MTQNLDAAVSAFLEHKRSIGRKYKAEEAELTLLMRFCHERGVRRIDRLTPGLLDDFLASRPRTRPRSFNHLLGVIGCLLEWRRHS